MPRHPDPLTLAEWCQALRQDLREFESDAWRDVSREHPEDLHSAATWRRRFEDWQAAPAAPKPMEVDHMTPTLLPCPYCGETPTIPAGTRQAELRHASGCYLTRATGRRVTLIPSARWAAWNARRTTPCRA